MKKIIAGAALAALSAGMAFADGPVANWSVAEFSGYGQAKWGVDLDAGKTGFENDEKIKLEFNLFDKGSKTTEKNGDIWAELKLSAGNTQWWDSTSKNELEKNGEKAGQGDYSLDTKFSFGVDEVKLHFGNAYIGLRSGDTQTGEYKFDGAIRSADNDNAKWLTNVGPADYSQGIVAGYGDNNFGAEVDFRSKKTPNTFYTDNYAFAAEAKLKDSNEFVSGLGVDAGISYNLSNSSWDYAKGETKEKDKDKDGKEVVKPADTTVTETKDLAHVLGFSANAAYKFKLDDKMFIKPAVGFTGTNTSAKAEDKTNTTMNLVFGAIFGWGATKDENAGVYFLNGDCAKKVTPGVSVVTAIPLASSINNGTKSYKEYGNTLALIVPSFYTANDVEGLTAGIYSEIAILRDKAPENPGDDTYNVAKYKNEAFAFAIAAAAKYDIKADAVTVTPQAGFRFANASYVDNGVNGNAPLSSNKVFDKMGIQKKTTDPATNDGKPADLYDGGFLNVKAGVNVNGLIKNTDIFVEYSSCNLLNGTSYDNKHYDVKAGTLNVGAKISL